MIKSISSGLISEHDGSFPCKRTESVTRYLKNYTSNYLKFCVLNGLMPVITVEGRFQAICGAGQVMS